MKNPQKEVGGKVHFFVKNRFESGKINRFKFYKRRTKPNAKTIV